VAKLGARWRAVLVAVLAVALLAVPATVGYANVSQAEKSFFKTLVRIPVSEEGIGYTDALGRGYPEGPNAFEVQGSNIYVLDNAHHRVLKYNKDTGQLVEKISFPEEFWAYSLAVDAAGKIYLLDVSAEAVIVLVDGKVIVNRLGDVEIEPVAGFGVTEQGEVYVVRSGSDAMETLVLRPDPSGDLTVITSNRGTMAPDGTLWQVERLCGSAKETGVSVSMLNLNKMFKFPDWLADSMSAFNCLGKAGTTWFFRITTDETDLIVGLNDQTGNVEQLVTFSPVRYAYPNKDVTIDADGNVYLLDPSADGISVVMVASWPSLKELPLLFQENQVTPDIREEETKDVTPASISRSQIMSTASAYHAKQWYCNRYNYEGTYAEKPWQRPRYINQGYNRYYQFVPYCWGGFSSLSGFDSELSSNWAAGNIDTTGNYKQRTAGVDCSGYVSRCWELSSKRNTYGLMSSDISVRLNNFAELKQGDILCNADHVMIFHYRDANGNYVLYESTKLNAYDRVAHTARSKSSVESSYGPYRYKYLLDP